jgi:hypothetical protein
METTPIRYSSFQIAASNNAVMRSANTWGEFIEQISYNTRPVRADENGKKFKAYCISPALYAPDGLIRQIPYVKGCGRFLALDLDEAGHGIDLVGGFFQEMGLNHLIYTTTKHTNKAPRLRAMFETSRELELDEVKKVWDACVSEFSVLAPDRACKDICRLYVAPTDWLPSPQGNQAPETLFHLACDLKPLDIDDLLRRNPHREPEPDPVDKKIVYTAPPGGFVDLGRAPNKPLKSLPFGHNLFDSPVVTSNAVNTYLGLGPGEHHIGLFSFMCSVIGCAKAKGYLIRIEDVCRYVEEIDRASNYPRDKTRLANIAKEADRAYRFCGN